MSTTQIISVRYPVQQLDINDLDTTITDYRATRIIVNNADVTGLDQIRWKFSIANGNPFYFTTTVNGTTSTGMVLDSSLNRLDLWLPPLHSFTVSVRRHVQGAWQSWTEPVIATSLGLINSYDKFIIMNRRTTTIPDVNPSYQGHFPT